MIVTDSTQLSNLCQKISHVGLVAIDTEFFRETTYYPKLCLIQVAFPIEDNNTDGKNQEVFAIDALLGVDLKPFWEILKNPKITKIFHAGREDIEIFFHLMGEMPKSVMDTQIMAAFCGLNDSIGYGQLVEKLLKICLNKDQQRSDWTRRPLSKKQIQYALLDVEYLIKVYEMLLSKLTKLDRMGWIKEETSYLINPDKYYNLDDLIRHKFHNGGKSLNYVKIIKKLVTYREGKAESLDVTRNAVIKDEVLINIAHKAPRDINQLQKIRGVDSRVVESMGNDIIQLVNDALKIPDEEAIKDMDVPLTSKQVMTNDLIKIVLEAKAREVGIHSRFIATKHNIHDVVSGKTKVKEIFKGWKYEVFGSYLEKLLKGELGVKIEGKEVILSECNKV